MRDSLNEDRTPEDRIAISGLSVMLEDDEELPYVELRLSCGGRIYRAAVLVAGDEWALNLRDEGGTSLHGDGEMYATQGNAILAALLMALDLSQQANLK